MQSLKKLPLLKGARVLVRVDYNVPLKGTRIVDARRIEASFPTIDTILKKGGVPVLVSHMGDAAGSLAPVARFLKKRYKEITFVDTAITSKRAKDILAEAKKGGIFLLENVRRTPGEEKNDQVFAKSLASLARYYVNDAFSASHRPHASIVGVPKLLPSYAGVQLEAEIAHLSSAMEKTAHPFLFILGGAKFATKMPLFERFLPVADQVVIAGALLNNFYKVAGFEVGASVVEAGYDMQIRKLLGNPKLLIPTDAEVMRGKKKRVVPASEVLPGDKIGDIGPVSAALIAEKIKKAKLVVWNGPTGWYEGGFTKGTTALAKALLASKAEGVIGGGDTAAVIEKMLSKKGDKIFVSTGGGATLEFLSKGTLPGIKALK